MTKSYTVGIIVFDGVLKHREVYESLGMQRLGAWAEIEATILKA